MKRPSPLLSAMVLVFRRTKFLDATDVVPAPIGPLHKFLSAGTPSSTSDVTSAPAGPSETVPGVPPTPPVAATDPPADTADPPAPALYILPALRTPGTPPAPRAAQDAPSTTGGAPPRQLYIPPTLCASSQSPAPTAGSTAPMSPPQAPRGPPARVPASSSRPRLRLPLHAPASTTACSNCSCHRRPGCTCTSHAAPTAQRGCCCPSCDQPARHGHTFEERFSDTCCVPRYVYVTDTEDLP